MTFISITKLYDLLSIKIGKETAENLTNFIEEKIKEEVENNSKILATKADFFQEVSVLKDSIRKVEINVIRWIFAFWVTIVLMMIGLYFKK
jgi:hypothetical protein